MKKDKHLIAYRASFMGVVTLFLLMTVVACGNRNTESRDPQARQLYEKSVGLTKRYIDSLTHVSDSASIERISKGYESAITKLNYEFTPDVYVDISEGENDTLTMLTLRFITLRDSLVYRLAHPLQLPDTTVISTDSLATVH